MGRFADALEDARRLAKGDCRGVIVDSVRIRHVHDFTSDQIKTFRLSTGMPQRVFALCLGVSQKTVEAWEGSRSHPDGAARRLLSLLHDDPDFFRKSGIFIQIQTSLPRRRPQRVGSESSLSPHTQNSMA